MADRRPCFVGIDIGTSGCRAIAIDAGGRTLAESRAPLPGDGPGRRDPGLWWRTVRDELLPALLSAIGDHRLHAIAVDGTSATVLLCDPDGQPLTPARLYDETAGAASLERVGRVAPADSPARSPSATLPKVLDLLARIPTGTPCHVLHQADWIVACLTGRPGLSDINNCLKLGYDPHASDWPGWVRGLVGPDCRLPRVHRPGSSMAPLREDLRRELGLDGTEVAVVAGTTDSIAAFIATGARATGDAVTSLGSTIVLKLVAERAIDAPRYGVYSHPFDDHWLVGGASNCGGAILARHFRPEEIAALSAHIDPEKDSGLDYYPLCGTGERFPITDPGLEPRLTPRPDSDVRFLHGLLEGLARVEAAGYARLEALGAPRPKCVLTSGGGAMNDGWRHIRERLLGIPVLTARQTEAAYGSALLARRPFSRQETKETKETRP